MTQPEGEHGREQARSAHPAQWSEDARPDGAGAGHARGGARPAWQTEEPDTPSQPGPISPLALVIALAAIAVPALWALGLWLGGAPGSRGVWPLAVVVLGIAGAALGYWLARRSDREEP